MLKLPRLSICAEIVRAPLLPKLTSIVPLLVIVLVATLRVTAWLDCIDSIRMVPSLVMPPATVRLPVPPALLPWTHRVCTAVFPAAPTATLFTL